MDGESGTRGHHFKVQKQHTEHTRLSLRQNAFSNWVVNMWNSLPASAVSAKAINPFKDGLENELAKQCNKLTYGIGYLWQANAV